MGRQDFGAEQGLDQLDSWATWAVESFAHLRLGVSELKAWLVGNPLLSMEKCLPGLLSHLACPPFWFLLTTTLSPLLILGGGIFSAFGDSLQACTHYMPAMMKCIIIYHWAVRETVKAVDDDDDVCVCMPLFPLLMMTCLLMEA